MDKKPAKIQVSGNVSQETFDEIVQISERENRSMSSTVNVLLVQALKERNRKKKGAKNE